MKIIMLFVAALFVAACSEKQTHEAMGRFEASEVLVSAETSGRIISIDAEEGDTLAGDRIVAVTDTMQLVLQRRQLEAQIETCLASRPDIKSEAAALRSQLAKQKSEERRFELLFRDGAATSKQLDDIRAEIKVIEGRLDALLSRLVSNTASINSSAAALRVSIEQTDDMISRCYIKSPITGTVLSKYVEKGEYVQPGRPLFKIADLNDMTLRSYLTSEQLADIKLGDTLMVAADFGGGRQREYKGRVNWISSESEFTPKTIQTDDTRASLVYAVKISVKNDGYLKIGFTGKVHLETDDK